MRSISREFAVLAVFLGVATGCDDSAGTGRLTLALEGETTITDGIAAGSEEEDIVDGWSVAFDTYVVSVGDVVLARGADEHRFDTIRVFDLRAVSGGSVSLVDESLPAGRYDRVGYSLLAPTADAVVDATVDPADLAAMTAGGCTYLVRGTLSKAGGQSCPGGTCHAAASIDFEYCVPARVRFEDCRAEGTVAPGFAIRSGGSTPVAFTIHGDHVFFDSFPGGAEIVSRRAQWLADADVDADGTVTEAELRSFDTSAELSQLFPSSLYSLANAPGGAITNAFDYVVAQMRTQGHFQGEGECTFDPLP